MPVVLEVKKKEKKIKTAERNNHDNLISLLTELDVINQWYILKGHIKIGCIDTLEVGVH